MVPAKLHPRISTNHDINRLQSMNQRTLTGNFAASFTYNLTGITPHVSITLQHVAHNTIDKCQHVATAVAGLTCNVGAFLASRLHCYFQWHEGSFVRSHNMLLLQKETCKIQPNLDWNSYFNWNQEISS